MDFAQEATYGIAIRTTGNLPPGDPLPDGCSLLQHTPMNSTTENTHTMNQRLNQPTQAIEQDLNQLVHDAGTLIAATADMAGDQIGDARKRLSCMLGRGREFCDLVLDKALEGTKAADLAAHKNLYQTVAIGVGIGVVMGYLFATRNRCACIRE